MFRYSHRVLGPFLACLLPLTATADLLNPVNPTIRNKLCVGRDCADSQNYGSGPLGQQAGGDTFGILRLQAPNPRIQFRDTSSEGFPNTSWDIIANSPSFSGQEFLEIVNTDTDSSVFKIEALARSNAIYVTERGAIGFGTSLPSASLHAVTGSSSSLRLERDASSGFVPRTFDLRVGNSGLQIQDATTSSLNTIVRIASGVPSFVLDIEAERMVFNDSSVDYDIVMESTFNDAAFFLESRENRIGLGTDGPAAPLHLERSSVDNPALAGILVENDSATTAPRGLLALLNNGQVYFTLEDTSIPVGANTGRAWNFQNLGGEFRVTTAPGGIGEIEMQLTPAGEMYVKGGYFVGNIGGGTTQLNVPDYVFSPDYDLKPLSEVQAFIETHSHLPDVPSAAQITETGLNMTEMQMTLLKKIEELTLYTLEQEKRLARVDALEARNAALGTEVAALRDMLEALAARD